MSVPFRTLWAPIGRDCLICTLGILIYGGDWVTRRDQCHWEKDLVLRLLERRHTVPCRAMWGASGWSGGRSGGERNTQDRVCFFFPGKARKGRVNSLGLTSVSNSNGFWAKGLGSSCLAMCAQPCPTLYNLMDCSLPGSSVHETVQARILEWAAISHSTESSRPRDRTWVSCVSCTGR